jgi:hypothetical protein
MGMDSLMAVELKSLLEKDTALPLPSTLTFNYPTIGELAGYLMKQLSLEDPPPQPVVATDTPSEPPAYSLPASDDLTEDELSELLIRKLQELK